MTKRIRCTVCHYSIDDPEDIRRAGHRVMCAGCYESKPMHTPRMVRLQEVVPRYDEYSSNLRYHGCCRDDV